MSSWRTIPTNRWTWISSRRADLEEEAWRKRETVRRVGLTFEADTGGEDLYLRIASVEPEGQVAMVFEY